MISAWKTKNVLGGQTISTMRNWKHYSMNILPKKGRRIFATKSHSSSNFKTLKSSRIDSKETNWVAYELKPRYASKKTRFRIGLRLVMKERYRKSAKSTAKPNIHDANECSVCGGFRGACSIMSFQNQVKPLIGNATNDNSLNSTPIAELRPEFATIYKAIIPSWKNCLSVKN